MIRTNENFHFWSSIEMFLTWLNAIDKGDLENEYTKKYIREGFKNALREGYDICKVKKEEPKKKKTYTSIYECRKKTSQKRSKS